MTRARIAKTKEQWLNIRSKFPTSETVYRKITVALQGASGNESVAISLNESEVEQVKIVEREYQAADIRMQLDLFIAELADKEQFRLILKHFPEAKIDNEEFMRGFLYSRFVQPYLTDKCIAEIIVEQVGEERLKKQELFAFEVISKIVREVIEESNQNAS